MEIIHATSDNFEQAVLQSQQPVSYTPLDVYKRQVKGRALLGPCLIFEDVVESVYFFRHGC